MAKLIILSPAEIAAIAASRGDGVEELLTPDPREVWADSDTGTAATIDIDLGAVTDINTVFLGYVTPPAALATWRITGGEAGYTTTTLLDTAPLRVPDAAGDSPAMSHALWLGDTVALRYVRLALTQPAGDPLTAGIVMVGKCVQPTFGHEWGAGRRPIDTGIATQLLGGGFGIAEGVRKAGYGWTLGDLTDAELEALWLLTLDRGQTRPILVVEDPATSAGLRNRIHYGLFTGLRQYERQQPGRTRWEFNMEEWL